MVFLSISLRKEYIVSLEWPHETWTQRQKGMTLRWAPDTCVLKISRAVNLWHTQVQSPAYFPLSPLRTPHCRLHVRQPFCPKVGYLSWKHVQTKKSQRQKGWLCRASQLRQRLALHTNAYCLNSSASRWSALTQHMSRIRSTLDSVSKDRKSVV